MQPVKIALYNLAVLLVSSSHLRLTNEPRDAQVTFPAVHISLVAFLLRQVDIRGGAREMAQAWLSPHELFLFRCTAAVGVNVQLEA